ncbi:MAG: SDR family NAD(P)-dependent oxidoreductase [Sphingomonadales bacterium]|nr:SDR family NAD(P)-dependent oxidoreductase [Sphingomonadales bacterium]
MTAFRDRYGRVAMVTGASSGIGMAFAEALAARGMDVIAVARRVDRLEALAGRLRDAHGVAVTPLAIDLGQPDAARAIHDCCAGHDVGLVVSNAGFGFKGAHEDAPPALLAEMLTVNCTVPSLLAQGFIPRLKARAADGRGAGLVMTASVEGLIGCPYSAAYSASKAMVVALGEALWGELAPAGIDVLTLCPGPTESEAAARQGVDMAAVAQRPAIDVARETLDRLDQGPTFVSDAKYQAMFDAMRAMPRREALTAMAAGMKPKR